MINLFMRVLLFSVLLSCCTMNTALTTKTQDRPSVPKDNCEELYYVDIHNSGNIDVADGDGHKTIHIGEMILFPPDVNYTFNESGGMVLLPLDRQFSLTWTVPRPGYLSVDIVKGCGNNHPTESVRYLGRPLVVGTKMLLRFDSSGPQDLRFDKNHDGKYAGIIKPEFVASGKAADDTERPKINFVTAKTKDSKLLVSLSATDKSGIYDLTYAFEDETELRPYRDPFPEFKPYTEPLTVDPANVKLIFVSSHDKVGNSGFARIPTSSDLMVRISARIDRDDPMLVDLQPSIINGESEYSNKYSYNWDLGDGSPHETAFRSLHTYKKAGSYTVTLTATDNLGRKAQSSRAVTIEPR